MHSVVYCLLSLVLPSPLHRATTIAKLLPTHAVHKCVSSKRKLWKALSERPWDSLLRQKYRDCVYKHRRALSSYHTATEECLISNNNLGAFYRYVNRRITSSTGVGTVVVNGVALTDDYLKADAFNNYFSSVSLIDDGLIPNCVDVPLLSILDHIIGSFFSRTRCIC